MLQINIGDFDFGAAQEAVDIWPTRAYLRVMSIAFHLKRADLGQ
jgi:hypothetical protein